MAFNNLYITTICTDMAFGAGHNLDEGQTVLRCFTCVSMLSVGSPASLMACSRLVMACTTLLCMSCMYISLSVSVNVCLCISL